tara:strand:+ start:1025 stop:1486 length:462 start_codon:yes stop_codon:yes gene_type:complete
MTKSRSAPVRRTRRTRRTRRRGTVRKPLVRRTKRNTNNTKIVEVDNVEKLNSVNNLLQKKRPALVWFYADWCGHCQSMKPEWEKFESKCGRTPGNKMVVKVNSNFQPNLTNNLAGISQHVQGYPSIFKVRGNRLSRYDGERHHASLLKALRTL